LVTGRDEFDFFKQMISAFKEVSTPEDEDH
jgi:hypothetical protein